MDYFNSIYRTQYCGRNLDNDVFEALKCKLTAEMNQNLCREFTPEEVKISLFHMQTSKSPGLNGMSLLFLQKYWFILGADITSAVLSILSPKWMLKRINFTNVAFIPKQQQPRHMSQLRSISPCNVVYKIILKVLAN